MNDQQFFRRVRNCNLKPGNSVRVWQDLHDPNDQYNVPDPSTMDDDEKRVFIKNLRARRGLEPLTDLDDDNT